MTEKEEGFIPEFRDFILQHIPTSEMWAESIAISMLSTACGTEKFVRSKIGHLKLNVWFLMIGPSGMAHKSTPLNYFVYPTLIALTDYVGYPTILPSRYSMEGMIEYLSKICSQGAIVRDEFTTIFKETTKGYLSDSLEFLSELYDGTMQKRFTRKTKLEQSTSVYVTFLTATTPYLYQIMQPSFFIQGTGNRILPILFEGLKEEELNDSPEDFFYDIRKDKQREEKLGKYAELLAGVNKASVTQLVPMPDSGQLWLDYRKEVLMEAKKRFGNNIYDLNYTYMVRLPEFALKLSALHQLSNRYKHLAETRLTELIITPDDMEWAIKKTRQYYYYFNKLLTEWRTRPIPEEPHTLDEQLQSVHNILLDHPHGMKWSDFRSRIQYVSRSINDILKTLYQQEKIIFVKGSSTEKGGKKPILLFAREYEKNLMEDYEELIWQRFAYSANLRE